MGDFDRQRARTRWMVLDGPPRTIARAAGIGAIPQRNRTIWLTVKTFDDQLFGVEMRSEDVREFGMTLIAEADEMERGAGN